MIYRIKILKISRKQKMGFPMKAFLILIMTLSLSPASAFAKEIGKPEICKATIAAIMGRKPGSIRLDSAKQDEEHRLSYVRDDGSLWAYRCKVEGTAILWASENGRWRTDEKISYSLSADRSKITITQTFDDGSELTNDYTAAQF